MWKFDPADPDIFRLITFEKKPSSSIWLWLSQNAEN